MLEERREVLGSEPGRRPRTWVTWMGVAIVAIAVVIVARQRDPAPSPLPPLPSATPSARPAVAGPPWGLLPPTRSEHGGRTALHLVFPDGSSAEMSYSTGLDLARLGV